MKKTPQTNAILLAPGGGPTLTFNGATVGYKASGAETDGAWALLEYALPPHFEGMAPHFHKHTYTGFYVLEGKVAFRVQARDFEAEAGAFVSVPPSTPHTFSNKRTQPAHLLEFILPGGAENYLKELAARAQLDQDLPRHGRFDIFLADE
jgi:mannose-6-phosphate isomerase-like protein (cupin superfamily)